MKTKASLFFFKRNVSQSSLQKIFTDGCSYYFSHPLRIMTKQVAGTAAVAKGERLNLAAFRETNTHGDA